MAADAAADTTGGQEGGTVWPIPARVVWEGAGEEEELVVMLKGGAGGGDSDGRRLTEKMQELQAAGKWFKVQAYTKDRGRGGAARGFVLVFHTRGSKHPQFF